MGDLDFGDFPFPLIPATSPFSARLRSMGGNAPDNDDDFPLPPMPSPEPKIGPSAGAPATPTVPLALDARANDTYKAESSSSPSGVASAPAAAPTADERKFNNRDFMQFLQVRSQKSDRWDNITKEELAWYNSFPVLVVPLSQHPTLPVTLPGDGWVRGYGPPDASSTTNSNPRYVIVQYLPLCYKSYQKPTCEYEVVRGKFVERVIPYNTLMESKRRLRELGPEDRWADTEVHFKNLKKKGKTSSLKRQDWEVTMEWAQMYLDRALELGREKSKMEELRRRESEEEHRKFEVEQQEKEKERGNKLGSELELQNEEASRRRGDGVYEAGAHKGEDDGRGKSDRGHEATNQANTAVVLAKNLKLVPGDWIFYWDRTKRVGTPEARRDARILEIRTVKEASEQGLERLVLDNDDVVLDDWVIQKYKLEKDSTTGEKTRVLDRRGNEVRRYKLVPGKLKGVESRGKRRAHELIAGIRRAAKACGAGSQLRKIRGFSDTEQDDDDASDVDEIEGRGDLGVGNCVESSSGHGVRGSPATKKRTREKAGLEGVSCKERGREE